MDSRPIAVHHFVELVNAADPLVSQDKGATFQGHLPGDGVLHDCSGQTNSGGTPARRVLTCETKTLDINSDLN